MKKILFYTICLLLCNGAFAQGGNESAGRKVYSLQDCLLEGLENNYSIKIQKNKQSVSDNNATIGNAGFLPSVSASAKYSGNAQDTETQLRDTREIVEENGIFNQTVNAGLNLNWTIFEGFNVISTYRKLQELKSQGELNTRLAFENLIADLTAEYYNYIQQMIRLKNLKYAMELSKERLRIVEQRYNLGNFSGLDYQQAKVDFNSDSSSFMKQQEKLKSSAIVLNELLAKEDLNNPIAVADTAIVVEKFLDFNDMMNSMMADNATLLYARSQSSVSELEYKITSSQSYPYLRLNAGYGYTNNKYNKGTNYYRGTLGADFGLTLGINIFDGNNARRLRRNAKLNIENAHLSQAEIEQGLKADLFNIWHAYENNLQILELEKENLVTAKLNHEIAMERYMLGNLSGIEMREAQKSLLDAEERLLSSQYNTKLCEISLLQISGKIKQYLQ